MKKLFSFAVIILISLQVLGQKRLAPVRTQGDILNEEYCSALFSTPDAVYFDILEDQNNASANAYLNILDWLKGRVAGLQVYATRDNRRIPYIRNQQVAVYVDEIRMDYGYLNSLPAADIAMIKVIKGPFVGSWGGSGAIAIYTVRGDEEEE